MDKNLGIFLIVVFLLATAHYINRRRNNIANVVVGKDKIIIILLMATVLIVVNYLYNNNYLGYLLAFAATNMTFSMYFSEGVGVKGFYHYARFVPFGRIPFEKVVELKVIESQNELILKVNYGHYTFDQKYYIGDKEKILSLLKENKLL